MPAMAAQHRDHLVAHGPTSASVSPATGAITPPRCRTSAARRRSYTAACTIRSTSDITASVCCLSADGGGDVAAVATASFSSGASSANCPP